MQTATQVQTISPQTIIETTVEEARRHHKEPLLDRYEIYNGYKRILERTLIHQQGAYDEYECACRNVAAALNI